LNEETLKNFFKVTKSYIIIPRGGLNPSGTITTDGRTCIRDPIFGKVPSRKFPANTEYENEKNVTYKNTSNKDDFNDDINTMFDKKKDNSNMKKDNKNDKDTKSKSNNKDNKDNKSNNKDNKDNKDNKSNNNDNNIDVTIINEISTS